MKPSRIIGPLDNPYMLRWHLLRIGKLPRIYLHRFMRSDDDRALHDHPWWFVSILLTGSYIEHTSQGQQVRRAGSIAYRDINHRHRIELASSKPVRTLFITGPMKRKWGFWCGERFVLARDFEGCN